MYQTQPWGAWNLNRGDKLRWEQKYYPALQLGQQPQMIHLRWPQAPGAQPGTHTIPGLRAPFIFNVSWVSASCFLQKDLSVIWFASWTLQLTCNLLGSTAAFHSCLGFQSKTQHRRRALVICRAPQRSHMDGWQWQSCQALGRMHLTSLGAGWRLETAK